LTPAHLDAHGSFENYRAAKGKLFSPLKENGKKLIGVNLDTPDAPYFLNFPANKKFGITLKNTPASSDIIVYQVINLRTEPSIEFELNGVSFRINLIGEFNAYNAALATACANLLDISLEQCSQALANFGGLAGRMQTIPND